MPSDEEWKQLEIHLGMSQTEANDTDWRGTNEGGKLKETETIHWNSPNFGATNKSGFTARAGGYRRADNGDFETLGNIASFWSAAESSNYNAWGRTLVYNVANVGRYGDLCYRKHYGFSIRLIRD